MEILPIRLDGFAKVRYKLTSGGISPQGEGYHHTGTPLQTFCTPCHRSAHVGDCYVTHSKK